MRHEDIEMSSFCWTGIWKLDRDLENWDDWIGAI
jgi:hypothetical protein